MLYCQQLLAGKLVKEGFKLKKYFCFSGIIELSTFLMDEDDLACRAHSTEITEEGLLCAATVMMFITLVYIGTDAGGGVRKPRGGGGASNGGLEANGGQLHRQHSVVVDPRFCAVDSQAAVMMGRMGGNGCESVLTPLSAPPPLLVSSLESNGGQHLIRNEIYQVGNIIKFFQK